MGKKYYLTDFNINNNYNAGSKAVIDVNAILEKKGYTPLFLGYGCQKKYIGKILVSLYCILTILIKLRAGDAIFIQYPITHINAHIKNVIFRIIKYKKSRIEILIHDLDSYRFPNNTEDTTILQHGDLVICHTHKMKEIIQDIGVNKSHIRVIFLFDYITNSSNINPTNFGNEIIFAGNLGKSKFIKLLPSIKNLKFNLYGLPEIDNGENVKYKGKFSPNDISEINGDWGLVWDGDSIDTCNGPLGKYLAINSSHKISLYIAAKKPVIIWDESSLRDFIIDNNLGISVKSLYEINDKIRKLSDIDKKELEKSLSHFSERLKRGEMLDSIL